MHLVSLFRNRKILVEAVEKELLASSPSIAPAIDELSSSTALNRSLKAQVTSLLLTNKKIEAVKLVKTELNTGLKEALVLVEEVDKETNPNYRSVNPVRG